MARHTVSHAANLYRGDVFYDKYSPDGRRGVEFQHLYFYNPDAIDQLDPDGVAAAQAVAGAGNLTINGALASGGVATMDVPRALEIDSSNAGDTTQTATITGTDAYGEVMVEDIAFNGTSAVSGQKAFKTVTQVAISAALTGNATCGTTDIIGFPVRVASLSQVIQLTEDGIPMATPVIVVADDTTATATTNDVRGTIALTTAANGTVSYGMLFAVNETATKDGVFGVAQFAG